MAEHYFSSTATKAHLSVHGNHCIVTTMGDSGWYWQESGEDDQSGQSYAPFHGPFETEEAALDAATQATGREHSTECHCSVNSFKKKN